MLSIGGASRIVLCLRPTDMRRSFTGLSALVYEQLGRPDDGAYYVFVNRRRSHVKILYWDGDGLALWYKRLEKGRFLVPPCRDGRVEMDRRHLSMLLDGVEPLRLKPRFRRSDKKAPKHTQNTGAEPLARYNDGHVDGDVTTQSGGRR